MEDALKKMASSSELGIKVVDVRIKQINLPLEVPTPSTCVCAPSVSCGAGASLTGAREGRSDQGGY